MPKSVEEVLRETLEESLGCDPEEVTPEALVIDDLGADSLDVVEIAMAMEEYFAITIPDEDVYRVKTVREWTEMVKKKLGRKVDAAAR